MAITTRQSGGRDGRHNDNGSRSTAGNTRLLTSTLETYRRRIGRGRRAGVVGVAAIAVGITWVAAAFCLLFNVDASYVLAAALGLTVAIPIVALVLELGTRPSLAQTARILDARMDNQQRLVTALELGNSNDPGPLDVTQIETTTRYLATFDPRAICPVRTSRPMLAVAAGLFCFALAIMVLKDARSFVPFQAQTLPAITQELAALSTPTVATGLPGSDLTPSPTSEAQGAQPSLTSAPQGDQQSSNGQDGRGDAASRADSQSAQSGLDKLGESLDGQSAAQQAADNLRKGNYGQAAKDISDLGAQSDQLSSAAKKGLADALDKAADASATGDDLRSSEKAAADALRKGEYKDVAGSMDNLGKSVQDTAGKVMSQQEMAKAYPSPTAQQGAEPQNNAGQGSPNNPTVQSGQQSSAGNPGNQGNQGGQQGQQGQGQQNSQQGGGQQSGNQPNANNGQDQSGGGGQGQSGQQGKGQQGNGQGGGQDQGGEGQPGAPGNGHRESGPIGSGSVNGGAQNPFELQGTQPQQANRPGDGDHPALSLDGSGSAGGTSPVAPGGASNVPGENSQIPVERWDVIQRYFSGK